jgi:hypothetical protein
MTKIVIPIDSALEPGGALVQFVANISHVYNEISKVPDAVNLTIDDAQASPEQKLVLDQQLILDILAEGGTIENYLFGIRQPSASASVDVPAGVPLRLFILGAVKNFSQWFANNADVWLNDVTDEIIYYNNPTPSANIILTGAEAEIIRQIDPVNYSFLTVAEVQTIISDPNWVKL